MIIVSGWLQVDATERNGYVEQCRQVVELARAAEGCLDFSIGSDLVDPGRVNVYERWQTDADVERFRGSGPSGDQQAAIRDADVRRYRISAVEDA